MSSTSLEDGLTLARIWAKWVFMINTPFCYTVTLILNSLRLFADVLRAKFGADLAIFCLF